MYSKIKNDDEWQMCHRSSSGCQTLPSVTWQLEWVLEKQREEGACSLNKWWQQMSLFTVFAHCCVHRFPSSSSIVVIVHLHHHVCHPSALSCASSSSSPLHGVLTMVVLHGGCHHVVLVVVVLWCWSVVVVLWLWSPLDKWCLVAMSSRVTTWTWFCG